MKNNIVILLIAVFLLNTSTIAAQYANLKVKEEFDLFNVNSVNNKPCTLSPYDDDSEFGDGEAFILDSYITMFKLTRDKAYLYKFMFESMCVVKNRNDIAGVNSQPCWGAEYQDGNIIGAFARYIYLIKVEEPALVNQTMHSFYEFQNYDWNEPENYPYPNQTPVMITTYGLFADWLSQRVDETLDWFIANGTFNYSMGILRDQSPSIAIELNKQVGFARAALFDGITDPNTYSYIPRANYMASNIKGPVSFNDRCSNIYYNQSLLRTNSGSNSYWWYHNGWKIPRQTCGTVYIDEPRYSLYTEFMEDLKHGAVDLIMFNDYHKFQSPIYISDADMIRFRNMFANNLYDGAGGFHNAVDGSEGPIQNNDCQICPSDKLRLFSMCYMPLEEFDGQQNTVGPNVYNIIMDFYQSDLAGRTEKPLLYDGLAGKGHADVVAAQWKYECTNLELYNRNVVYDQDFFARNKLIITPGTSNLPDGVSYAAPTLLTPEFIVPNGVTVHMTAGESITFKPGVQIKTGSYLNAAIVASGCTDGQRLSAPSQENENYSSPLPVTDKNTISETTIKPRAVPNPFSNSTTIQFALAKASVVSFKIVDNFGKIVYQSTDHTSYNQGYNEVIISTDNFAPGLFSCILNIDNKEIQTIKLIKQ